MKTDSLYSFVMRGLLTEQSLDKTERTKSRNFSKSDFENLRSILSIEDLDEELVKQAQKMSYVYTAICAFENTIRKFISQKLIETHGIEWWSTPCVSEKIRTKAESRREEESKIRWHTPRGDSIINYTEFGDLVTIIRINWADFEAHIQSIEWAEQIIKSLERSRNVIMHSGELVNQDIERVGMLIRDWQRQVG